MKPSIMSSRHIFKLTFQNQGKIYEIYARHVGHSDIFGFIEVRDLVFGERSNLLVDPSEERIKSEFDGVQRSLIPLHQILRIDEVEKQGVSKISSVDSAQVAQFPGPVYAPGGDKPVKP